MPSAISFRGFLLLLAEPRSTEASVWESSDRIFPLLISLGVVWREQMD
jgi:hypothetical protein